MAAYEIASVEPAEGSTVTTATARNAAAMTARTGGRAPRATATSPAITPAQPRAIAAQSDPVTNVAVRCSACHQGGPPAAPGMTGTDTFGPAAEIPMMMSIETAIAAAASQPMRRVSPGEPEGLVLSSPPFSLANSPACRS